MKFLYICSSYIAERHLQLHDKKKITFSLSFSKLSSRFSSFSSFFSFFFFFFLPFFLLFFCLTQLANPISRSFTYSQ